MEKLEAYCENLLFAKCTRGYIIGGDYYFPSECSNLLLDGWELHVHGESGLYDGGWRGKAKYYSLKRGESEVIHKFAWSYDDPEEDNAIGGGAEVIRVVWGFICFNPKYVQVLHAGRLNMMVDDLDDVALKYMSPSVKKEYLAQKAKKEKDLEARTKGVVLLFPGQGAQQQGMASQVLKLEADHPVREMYGIASRKLIDSGSVDEGFDLLQTCIDGPDVLNETKIAQPAIFVTSMAAIHMLQTESPEMFRNIKACAGLSLGEYSALCFAGTLSFEDCLDVVIARATAMHEEVDGKKQGMIALVGITIDDVKRVISKTRELAPGSYAGIANKLGPKNNVISCDSRALEKVEDAVKELELQCRVVVLKVAGAFHSDKIQGAVPRVEEVLLSKEIVAPSVDVYANVDGEPHKTENIVEYLKRQMVSPVLWQDTTENLLKAGYRTFYEVGAGSMGMRSVLRGLVKKIVEKKLEYENVLIDLV